MCSSRSATRRVDVIGREQAGDAHVEIGEGDPHQDQRQHEVGRGDADIVDHGQDVIADRARVCGGVDAGRDRQHPGEHEGEESERQRQPQHLADQLGIGPLVLERQAEVAVQQMLHPQEVLHDHRLIEAVLVPHGGDLLGRQRGTRRGKRRHIGRQEVSRRRLDDDEDDERVDHHQQRQESQPLQDVTRHGLPILSDATPCYLAK
jgi:hypothetical protein